MTNYHSVFITMALALGGVTPLPSAMAQPHSAGASLTVDQLLSISSVVGGETPRWSPDGETILFVSGLTGGLMTVPFTGGFPTRIPVDLGGRGHFLASQMPTWSPRGHWISYVSDKSGSQEIWLWSVQDGRDVQLTDLGGRINALSWSADEQWIAFSGDRYGNFDIWKVGVDAGEVHQLTSDPRYEVFPTWSPDSNSILYVMLDESWVDHDVIQIMANGEAPRVVVRDTHFFDYGAGTTFGYPQVSPDGTTLLFRSQRTEWINYWTVPLSGGDPRSLAPAQADQSQAKWSPDGTSIVYVENHNGTHELRVVNVNDGEPTVLVSPSMGATASPDWSPDGRMVSYTRSSVTRPQDLYVVAVESGQPRPLTHSMPAGQLEERLVIPSKVTYPSSDGLRIAAYLYEPPPGPATTRYPGVLWIHGGPTSQFSDTFQQHVQFFVQRGYVLLLPNIRGSSGYGREFEEANNGCWGHCDLEDVLAGVAIRDDDRLARLESVALVDLHRGPHGAVGHPGVLGPDASQHRAHLHR